MISSLINFCIKAMKPTALFALVAISLVQVHGEVTLPKVVSDGMVLQRNARVRIWGRASDGEKVNIHFQDSTYTTSANVNGEWAVMLSNLKAGGPYVMTIDATNSITITNILVGDVWVCSGQSNMGLALGWLGRVYQDEIDKCDNPNIRQFLVPAETNFIGREKDLPSGTWQCASSKDMRTFTAVGYFFAKKLYETYKVPIGLINASLGGSSAEAWISEESIQSFPKYAEDARRFKDPSLLTRTNKEDDERDEKWSMLLRQNDEGYRDPQNSWCSPDLITTGWGTMHLPGYWADAELGPVNGVVWFRREITVPPTMVSRAATLELGRIVDADSVFINGTFVGSVGSQYAPRIYRLPTNLLREGQNTIVVRVTSFIHHGGFVPGKIYRLSAGEETIDLEGDWKYRLGAKAEPLEDRLFAGKIPTGLFNCMIAPILPYGIKGVVWYQGESNTSRAFEHFDLFKLLIHDWRENWHQGDFPFLYVQLPNFIEGNSRSTLYDWAYFRESQLKALALPATGMAVSIDIGEGNDIHPVNKRDVGYRLAMAARRVAYGEKQIVHSGPLYRAMKITGRKITVMFSNVGGGLVAKGGTLTWFEICGADNQFVPAKARIEHNAIVVWSDDVPAPVAVRYAWAGNPEGANLYNKEGLPASPFRTSELY
jgi:sialate O-acetylesterase